MSIRLSILISRDKIDAIARRLNAQSAGLGYSIEDDEIALDVLTRLVSQAAILYKIKTKPVLECVDRDYSAFGKSTAARRRALSPRKTHLAPR